MGGGCLVTRDNMEQSIYVEIVATAAPGNNLVRAYEGKVRFVQITCLGQ